MITSALASVIILRATPVAPEPRVERCAFELGHNGYTVAVLAWDREGTNPLVEQKQNFSIHRFRLEAPFGKLSLLFYMPFWWFFLCLQLLICEYDIIHACDLDTALPTLIIGKLRKKKIVYDIFDFYSGRIASWLPRYIVAIVEWFERFAAQSADVVIIPNPEMRNGLEPARLKKLEVIANSPSEKSSNISFLGGKNDFMLFYAGILNRFRGIQHVVKATRDLPFVTFVIAGFGENTTEFKNVFSKTANVVFLGKIPHEEVIKKTLEADLIVAFYDPSWPSYRYASTANKVFEAMMCRKPILTNYGTSLTEFVRKVRCGIVVEYGNVLHIRESIILLKNNPEFRRQLGENGYEVYVKRYSWEIMKARLLRIYKTLTD